MSQSSELSRSSHNYSDRTSAYFLRDKETQQYFETAIDAIAIVDCQGYCIEVNSATCQLLNCPKEDIIGYSLRHFVQDEIDFEQQWQRLQQLRQNHFHFVYVPPYGSKCLIEYTQHLQLNQDYHLAILRDITQTEQAQTQLQKLTQKLTSSSAVNPIHNSVETLFQDYHLKQIVRHLPGVVYQFRQRLDGTYHFPYASEGLKEVYGVSPEKVSNDASKVFEFVHPDDFDRVVQSIQESAANMTPWYCEHRVCLPNRQLWLLGHSTPHKAPDGSIIWHGFIQDITTRKKAELTLKDREEKFRGIIENLNDMVYVANADGTFSYVSPRFQEVMGYELSELIGMPFDRVVHPDDLHICVNALQKSFQGEKMRNLEYRVLHKDNQYYWHASNVSALKNEKGEVIACLGIASYIHDQKQKDILLQKTQEQYRILAEASPIGVFLTNAAGDCTYVNETCTTITGVSREESLGSGWSSTIHPEDAQRVYQEWYNSACLQQPFRSEYRFIQPDNSVKWVLGQNLPIINNGEIEGYVGTLTDLTDRKHYEQALRLIVEGTITKVGQDFFKSCVQYLAQVLQVRYAVITQFMGENKLQGQSLAFWAGNDWGENFTYDLADTPDETTKYGHEIRHYADDLQSNFPKDKRLAELKAESYAGIPILDSAGNHLGVVAVLDTKPMEINLEIQSDILQIFAVRVGTELERLQAENALRQSEDKLRQQTQALEITLSQLQNTQTQLIQAEKMSSLGQLVAGIAHEINNPVSFIYSNIQPASNYSQDLISLVGEYEKYYPNPPETINQFREDIDFDYLIADFPKLLNSMQTGANRIRDIVKSLRTFSRLDEADLKEINIRENLESTLVILQNRLKGRDGNPPITVNQNYTNIPLIECYGGLLNQVFMNLLVNGIDAIEQQRQTALAQGINTYTGEITITTQTTKSNQVTITIADNGCGMTPAVKEKIFNPFFTTKSIGKGTGMGLAISYQIVTENHGGMLHCDSAVGQGTIFVITLPIHPEVQS